ncbi:hypothetical protein ILYODFUR_002046 [Ilyodon furcidens]|uniref:Uncharacterized protein n=1 Tax=Ilyodon furcidens TaxID=33524 RepID=A0ABV0UDF7_9TELE
MRTNQQEVAFHFYGNSIPGTNHQKTCNVQKLLATFNQVETSTGTIFNASLQCYVHVKQTEDVNGVCLCRQVCSAIVPRKGSCFPPVEMFL